MKNRFPGRCYRCGEMVQPGEGHFERLSMRRRENLKTPPGTPHFLVQHVHCCRRYEGTNYSIWNRDGQQ